MPRIALLLVRREYSTSTSKLLPGHAFPDVWEETSSKKLRYRFGRNFGSGHLIPRIVEISKKTDISIEIESLERSKHRRVTSVTFAIEEQAVPEGG